VFLIADAPPHRRAQGQYSYQRDLETAVSKGIKVFTVAASGLNLTGELVMRQLSQYTMGRFVVLDDGATGARRSDLAIDTRTAQAEALDALIIRLIREEQRTLGD